MNGVLLLVEGSSVVMGISLICVPSVRFPTDGTQIKIKSVKIENNPANNPSIEVNNSTQQYGFMSPSAPPFNPSFVEENKNKGQTKIQTIEEKIAAIKAIKPGDRNALHNKQLHQYELELLKEFSHRNMA